MRCKFKRIRLLGFRIQDLGALLQESCVTGLFGRKSRILYGSFAGNVVDYMALLQEMSYIIWLFCRKRRRLYGSFAGKVVYYMALLQETSYIIGLFCRKSRILQVSFGETHVLQVQRMSSLRV